MTDRTTALTCAVVLGLACLPLADDAVISVFGTGLGEFILNACAVLVSLTIGGFAFALFLGMVMGRGAGAKEYDKAYMIGGNYLDHIDNNPPERISSGRKGQAPSTIAMSTPVVPFQYQK